MQGLFTGQILADKLAKLNSSQQSIETLSHWCIFHRRSAKQIVDIWEKEFSTCPAEQRVPFLYLANDILQNSRRKGGDFVNEFWRVLPRALRNVMKNGNDSSRSTVLRLIDIWEERKVFGSHPQGLRVEFLGRDAPPSAKNNDALLPEKLAAVYKAFSDKLGGEDAVIDRCNTAVLQMESLEKDIDVNAVSGQETIILDELQHQEHVLLESMQQLEAVDIARSSIVFQLKETLRDQEAKLERTRLLLQAAHSHVEQSRLMQQQIYDVLNGGQAFHHPPEEEEAPNGGLHHGDHDSDNDQEQEDHDHQQEVQHYEIPGMGSHGDEPYVPTEVKGFDPLAAAEVAAKLASSGSAAMFSSVLASLAGDTTVVPPAPAASQEDEGGNIPATQYQEDVGNIQATQYRSQEDDILARTEKRQKLADDDGDGDGDGDRDGGGPGLSLSPKTQENDVNDDGQVGVNDGSLPVSSVTMAATTQFLEASSVLLPPAFSFSQGISFAMPAATATPTLTTAGCAPENYSDVQSSSLSFLLQKTTTSTPQQ